MKKMLLADADLQNTEVLATALSGEGYKLECVHSPESWNRVTNRKSFSLIIMDESFLSLSRHLFALNQEAFRAFEKTPIIVMTEYPEIVEHRYKFPRQAKFLLKPFQAEEMFSLVRQIFFEGAVSVF